MCSSVITTLILGYFYGSDTFFLILKGRHRSKSVSAEYQSIIEIISLVFFILYCVVLIHVKDKKELTGFAKKSNSLTKGLFFKRRAFPNLLLFGLFVTCHLAKLSIGGMKTHILSVILVLSVLGNLNNLRNMKSVNDDEIADKIGSISKIELFVADCDKFEFPKLKKILYLPEAWCFAILRSTMETSCNVFFS